MADESRNEEILEAIINNGTYDEAPQSRNEAILIATLNDEEYTEPPQSRIEELLLELKEKIEQGGGGGGGSYADILEIKNTVESVSVIVVVE